MRRIPTWALLTTSALLAALSISGLIFSVHTSARAVYAALLLAAAIGIANTYKRNRT